MTLAISPDQLKTLAPKARAAYAQAFQNDQAVLAECAILDKPLRLAHFMAQVLHESGALTVAAENLDYSAQRLPVVWPSRFQPKGPLDPGAYAHAPEKLANMVYGGRMGNTADGDGFRYRGRGLLQLTGRDAYRSASGTLAAHGAPAPDLEQDPDAVCEAPWCLRVAAFAWLGKGCNALADQDDVGRVTLAINGGAIGLAERGAWLHRTKLMWP